MAENKSQILDPNALNDIELNVEEPNNENDNENDDSPEDIDIQKLQAIAKIQGFDNFGFVNFNGA